MLSPSWRVTARVLNAIPTAFIGGEVALVVTGQSLTVASVVGFVSLGGIADRNGILPVTHDVHLMKGEGQTFYKDTVLRGTLERLVAVLMTAHYGGVLKAFAADTKFEEGFAKGTAIDPTAFERLRPTTWTSSWRSRIGPKPTAATRWR